MISTIGELISEFMSFEATQQRARDVGRKVTGAAEKGTRNAYYAERASDIQNDAIRIYGGIVRSPGYTAVKQVCEAEYGHVTAEKLRQMWGRLSVATGLNNSGVNKLPLQEFAERYVKYAASPDLARIAKSQQSQPLLAVDRWSDLGVGINADRVFWAITPVPERGGRVVLSNAVKLVLGGKQWPSLLKLLAESEDGSSVPRAAVLAAFDYQPDKSNLQQDGRARPGVISAEIEHQVLPTQIRPAIALLNRALATLASKLREQVKGPMGGHGKALYVDGELVRSGFVVRYLIPDGEGHYFFGCPR